MKWLYLFSITCVAIVSRADQPGSTLGISLDKPATGVFVQVGQSYMVPYAPKIPGSDVEFEMVPVPGGTFMLGSPADEIGRRDDEGPQIQVHVAPMWVGKLEVTQAEYREFELLYQVFIAIEERNGSAGEFGDTDVVTAPTPLYDPQSTYEWGDGPKYPAGSMTQYAAQQYTKWLSAITKCQYRLPTESEWEYACRAGSDARFSWGDDASLIDQHAWYFGNSPDGYSHGGLKKPNAFGLYDMHGNVGEWTVNAYTKDGYKFLAQLTSKRPVDAVDCVRWPETSTSCVVRGGTFEFDGVHIRCSSRLESSVEWKDEDAELPKSPWWNTSDPARGVGFRLFRSLEPLDQKTISKFWDHTSPEIHRYVRDALRGGRGKIGILDENVVPAAAIYKKERAVQLRLNEIRRERLRKARPE